MGHLTVDPANEVRRAVLWEDGQLTDLGTLGGESSRARHINECGQVVGVSQTADGTWHHFVWTSGEMFALAPSLGDNPAYDINDNGQIIGQTRRGEPGPGSDRPCFGRSTTTPSSPPARPRPTALRSPSDVLLELATPLGHRA